MPHAPGHTHPFTVELLRQLEEQVRKKIQELKEKIQQEIYNQIAKIVEKIPYLTYTPPKTFEVDKEGIRQLLLGYACGPPINVFVAQLKDKALNTVDRVAQPIIDTRERIVGYKAKAEEIIAQMDQAKVVLEVIGTIGQAVIILHISLAVAIKVMPLQWATGGMMLTLIKAADYAEATGKTLSIISKVFTGIFDGLQALLFRLLQPLDAAMAFLDQCLPFLDMIKQMIEAYYLQYLSMCAGIPGNDFTDSDGNLNDSLFPNPSEANASLNDYYNQLINDGKDNGEYIQIVYKANYRMIGYRRRDKEFLLSLIEEDSDDERITNL